MNLIERIMTIVLYSVLSCTICGNVMYLIWIVCKKILVANGRHLEINRLLRMIVIAYAFPIGILYLDLSTTFFYGGKIVAFQTASSSQKFTKLLFIVLLIIWLVGVCVYSIRLLWGRAKIEKALLLGSEVGGEEKYVIEKVKENIGYNKAVKVYKWPFSSTPMVVHGNRILLPLNITDSDTLRICLTHELNHIAAGDLLWSSICNIICLFQWFNPIVYKWREEIYLWGEIACDIHSLKVLPKCSQKEYYLTVLKFCDANNGTSRNGICLSDNAREIEGRIKYMKRYKNKIYFKALATTLTIICMVLTIQTSIVSAKAINEVDSKLLDETFLRFK